MAAKRMMRMSRTENSVLAMFLVAARARSVVAQISWGCYTTHGKKVWWCMGTRTGNLQTLSNSVKNIPDTKHCKIWDRVLRLLIQGKQKQKVLRMRPRTAPLLLALILHIPQPLPALPPPPAPLLALFGRLIAPLAAMTMMPPPPTAAPTTITTAPMPMPPLPSVVRELRKLRLGRIRERAARAPVARAVELVGLVAAKTSPCRRGGGGLLSEVRWPRLREAERLHVGVRRGRRMRPTRWARRRAREVCRLRGGRAVGALGPGALQPGQVQARAGQVDDDAVPTGQGRLAVGGVVVEERVVVLWVVAACGPQRGVSVGVDASWVGGLRVWPF